MRRWRFHRLIGWLLAADLLLVTGALTASAQTTREARDDGKAFGDIATYQTAWRHIAARAPNLTVLSIEVRLFYCNIPSECFIPMSDFRHLRELTLVEAVVSWSAMPILSTFSSISAYNDLQQDLARRLFYH